MTLALLVPAGLAALAALLVPLLLHLARRSEQRVTDFAALRWLQAQPRPRRKRRFDERLLLLVRLLLLAAAALLLAQPVLTGRADPTPWIVAAPGVPAARAQAIAGDTRARLHWLAPGFPPIDASPPVGTPPLASLLRELDAGLPAGTPLTVLVPPVLDGADAERVRLGRAVDWRIVEDASVPSLPTPPEPLPALEVRAAANADGLRYLRAAGIAWEAQARGGHAAAPATGGRPSVRVAEPAQPLAGDARNLVWLGSGTLPAEVRDRVAGGGSALLSADVDAPELADAEVLWTDARGDPLVRGTALGRGRLMRFTRALAPAAMPQLLEADFPRQLRALFEQAPPAPGRVDAREYAPIAGAPPYPPPPMPLAPWLLCAIALLFLLERWLASAPRRESEP